MRALIGATGAVLLTLVPVLLGAGGETRGAELDATVRAFLDRHRGTWRDLNVPALAERAGQGSFTLALRNIADEIAKFHAMGVDTSDQTSSPRVKTVMIVDPAGNHIALAEALDPALAK